MSRKVPPYPKEFRVEAVSPARATPWRIGMTCKQQW